MARKPAYLEGVYGVWCRGVLTNTTCIKLGLDWEDAVYEMVSCLPLDAIDNLSHTSSTVCSCDWGIL